jgi:hypothetical protein
VATKLKKFQNRKKKIHVQILHLQIKKEVLQNHKLQKKKKKLLLARSKAILQGSPRAP